MATGPGKRRLIFHVPTTLPGPHAIPTVVTGASGAAGPGKYG